MSKQINIGLVSNDSEVSNPPLGMVAVYYKQINGETYVFYKDSSGNIISLSNDIINKQDRFWKNLTNSSVDYYTINEIVNHNGVLYKNLTGVNTNITPDLDNTNWEFVVKPFESSETIYVDKNGLDTNLGKSITSPKKTITGALTELGAAQGYTIDVSTSTYTENLVINTINTNIKGVSTPSDARITFIDGTVDLDGVNTTRVRLSNFSITGAFNISGTQGRHYFKNIGFNGGLTIGANTNWIILEDCFINNLTVENTFTGVIYIVRSTMEGSTLTVNTVSPLQVVFVDSSTLPSISRTDVTYTGTNYNATGASRSDASHLYMSNENLVTDTTGKKVIVRDDITGKFESVAIKDLEKKDTLIWGYQDFNAVTSTNLTLTQNSNADTLVTGVDFITANIINNSVVVTLQDDVTIPYSSGLFGFRSGEITATNTNDAITLSATPRVEDNNIRVWFKYRSKNGYIPGGYNEAPKFVVQAWLDSVDNVFMTEEEGQYKFWKNNTNGGSYLTNEIVNYSGVFYRNIAGNNSDTTPDLDLINWERVIKSYEVTISKNNIPTNAFLCTEQEAIYNNTVVLNQTTPNIIVTLPTISITDETSLNVVNVGSEAFFLSTGLDTYKIYPLENIRFNSYNGVWYIGGFGLKNVDTTGVVTGNTLVYDGVKWIDNSTLNVDVVNGNVGVGTISPTQLLHLNKSTGNVILSLQRGTGTASIGVDNGGSIASGSNAGDLVIRPTGTTGTTHVTNSAGVISMSLLESGNVGIGTATPTANLQVDGAIYSEIRQSVNGVVKTNLYTDNAISAFDAWDGNRIVLNAGGAERLTVLPSGKVGIGTSTPSSMLHIIGTGNIGTQSYKYFDGTNQNITIAGQATNILSASIYTSGHIVTNGAMIATSDEREKKDIENINYGIETVMNLRPTEYVKKDYVQHGGRKELGFIAQEVEQVIPEVVTSMEGDVAILQPWNEFTPEDGVTYNLIIKDKEGEIKWKKGDDIPEGEIFVKSMDVADKRSVSYDSIVPILTKAIQEQQKQIEKLETTVQKFLNQIQKQ